MSVENKKIFTRNGITSTLYLGDCREIAPTLSGIDAVITDPPYGTAETHDAHLSSVTLKKGEPDRQALGFDGITKAECVTLATHWTALAARWVVFTCEWKFMSALEESGILVRFGIWRKLDGAPQFTGDRPGMGWEAVAICHREGKKQWNGGGNHAFWSYPKGDNGSDHPTAKPIKLLRQFVKLFTNEGETVLDPFMGGGTTALACLELRRNFIGIELDPKHYQTSCDRIQREVDQGVFF